MKGPALFPAKMTGLVVLPTVQLFINGTQYDITYSIQCMCVCVCVCMYVCMMGRWSS